MELSPKTLAFVRELQELLTLILEGEEDFAALEARKAHLTQEVATLEATVDKREERVAELEQIHKNLFAEAKALDVRLDKKRPKLTGDGRLVAGG